MEEYKALAYIFQLSVEISKENSLFYHIGHLFGYTSEELILILLYSHVNYKLSFYSIFMSKYLIMSSFPLFLIYLHQNMLTLKLESHYFYSVLRKLVCGHYQYKHKERNF